MCEGSKRLWEIVLFLLQRLHFTTDAAKRALPGNKAPPTSAENITKNDNEMFRDTLQYK